MVPREDKRVRDAAATAPARPAAADGDAEASRPQATDRRDARDGRPSPPALPPDPSLAEFRSRLEEKLAARTFHPRNLPVKIEGPKPTPFERAKEAVVQTAAALREAPPWLTIVPVVACLIAAGSIWWVHREATAIGAAALARDELAQLRQAVQQERDKADHMARDLGVAWRQLSAQATALADKAAQERELGEVRQVLTQTEEMSRAYEQMLTEERNRTQVLEEQLAARREAIAAAAAGTTAQGQEIAKLRQTLKQAEERSAAHEQSLVKEQGRGRQFEEQLAAQGREATSLRQALKQASDRASAQEQSLAQERDRSRQLETQLATRRETMAAAAADKAAQEQELGALRQALKQAEERSAGYEQVLTQERSRISQLEGQLAARQQPITVAATKPAAEKPATEKPATVAVASAVPLPIAVPPDPDLQRLMARARLLLAQGDISAARIVLERAAESGNGPALFALAETFDPSVLSSWGTLGTQGDLTRAQELYARAFASGVLEAKERMAGPR